MTDLPWWERWPDVRTREFAAFAEANISVDDVREAGGVLQLDLTVSVEDYGEVELTATYPDSFPFFRPVAQLRGDDAPALERHVHPFGGDLCLLGRRLDEWWPSDTLAGVLTRQLPGVFATGLGDRGSTPAGEQIRALEEVQAEPFSAYYTCYAPGAMLMDSTWQLPADRLGGRLQISLAFPSMGAAEACCGIVSTIVDDIGQTLATFDIEPPHGAVQLTAPWIRLAEPICHNTPDDIAAELDRLSPGLLATAQAERLPKTNTSVQVVGLTFPEEREHRDGNAADGWVFLVRLRTQPPGRRGAARARRPVPTSPPQTVLVRAAYVGRADLAVRVPELKGLADKHVAIFGLGALGGFIAEHLARAGVGTLTLLDRDFFDPATLPRHAATIEHSGWPKVEAVAAIARRCNPYVTVNRSVHSLGLARSDGTGPSETTTLATLLNGVDLVIDATAAVTPAFLLAQLAAERGIPIIVASASDGGWGGRVVRVRPTVTEGCYSCLVAYVRDEERDDAGDQDRRFVPPRRPDDRVQPAACAEPTFTGSGSDLAEVSLLTSRLAVATVQTGVASAYPDFQNDVFVVALRDSAGLAIAPAWTSSPLPPHPACTGHTTLTT